MKSKVREKERAIELRRGGASYREILSNVQVSKSTVSAWLKDYPLTKDERRILRKMTDASRARGRLRAAAALIKRRKEREEHAYFAAKSEFTNNIVDPFFPVGVALYWAEGTKRFNQFAFTNSDPDMMHLMLLWIERFLGIHRTTGIRARLFTHRPFADENFEEYWSTTIKIPRHQFLKTSYKPSGLLVKKRPAYRGCLRISLSGINNLRKMLYWQEMLVDYYHKSITLE